MPDLNDINQDEFQKNRKQFIKVGDHQFDFTKNDSIFRISHSQIEAVVEQGSTKEKKEKVVPITGSCFCCKKDLTAKVKQDRCDFCTLQGCKECIYKKYPYPKPIDKETIVCGKGRICRVCETKFYIKKVIKLNLFTLFQNLDLIFKSIDKKEIMAGGLQKEIIA